MSLEASLMGTIVLKAELKSMNSSLGGSRDPSTVMQA